MISAQHSTAVPNNGCIGQAPGLSGKAADIYRTLRFRDPHTALGRAVMQLKDKPGFSSLRFGSWCSVLVGQIDRGHYFFLQRDNQIVGMAGWSRSTEELADSWMAGQGDLSFEQALTGDCIIINAWQANDTPAQVRLVHEMRQVLRDVRFVYARRSYAGGRNRFLKLPMSRFVEGHIRRGPVPTGT